MKRLILFVALKSEFPITIPSDDIDIQVVYTGVGKVNAAMTATEVLASIPIEYLDEYEILNFGSAGAPTEYIGKLIKCGKFRQGDIQSNGLFDDGVTPFDENLYTFNTTELIFDESAELCVTEDRFNTNPSTVCDMEAYAIAKVCQYFGVPFTAYKYISDSGDVNDWEHKHMNGIKLFVRELGIDI